MNDMSSVIIPKSDQQNSDDFIAGPRTIKITGVKITSGEQPCSIFFEGDEGKPWKCCKSMARVLVYLWGPDATKYVGRSVTLYRDPKVTWGGMAVGGIRISHMSHIDETKTLVLRVTKGNSKPFIVQPMPAKPDPKSAAAPAQKDGQTFVITAANDRDYPVATLDEWIEKITTGIAGYKSAEQVEALINRNTKNFATIDKTAVDHVQAKARDRIAELKKNEP